jgi:putative transposase
LYNDLLEERLKENTNYFAQTKAVTAVRREDKFLGAVNAQVLQDVALRLDMACSRFFKGLSRRPRFKRAGRYKSFTYPQLGGFRVLGGEIRLSKIGLIKIRPARLIAGTPKTCTIIMDVDVWFACVTVETENSQGIGQMPCGPAVGVDLGINRLVTLSDGKKFENPRVFVRARGRITILQRQLSRRKVGSKNRQKSRIALAKAWRRVRNQRSDLAHKISAFLSKEYSTIVFEDLNISNMVRNHRLASAIMDASWGNLRRLAAYKAERRGGRVILVNPKGTSQKCSRCGEMVAKELSERIHDCRGCGLVVDRDVNAARNILRVGLEQARVEEQPLLFNRRRISKFVPLKQEARGTRPTGSTAGSSIHHQFLLF